MLATSCERSLQLAPHASQVPKMTAAQHRKGAKDDRGARPTQRRQYRPPSPGKVGRCPRAPRPDPDASSTQVGDLGEEERNSDNFGFGQFCTKITTPIDVGTSEMSVRKLIVPYVYKLMTPARGTLKGARDDFVLQ